MVGWWIKSSQFYFPIGQPERVSQIHQGCLQSRFIPMVVSNLNQLIADHENLDFARVEIFSGKPAKIFPAGNR